MKKKRKIFRNSAVFLALITLTFYIILKDQNPIDILKIISSAKPIIRKQIQHDGRPAKHIKKVL